MISIQEAVENYLISVAEARSERTARTYRNAMNSFCTALRTVPQDTRKKDILDPQSAGIESLSVDRILVFIRYLKTYSTATENLYLSAAAGFYDFLAAEYADELPHSPNLPRLRELISKRARKQGRRRPKFPRYEIEKLIDYSSNLSNINVEKAGASSKTEAARLAERKRARLRNLRDRAFILLLADTGLRVSEACALLLGDVDFLEGRLDVLGKGDDEAEVRVSRRALNALQDYLQARDLKMGRRGGRVSGEKEKSLPLFVRHDRGAGGEAAPIAASTAWDFVRERAIEAVGETAATQIHPHSFRHYFVTVVLLATNNIEKARRLARHKNIATTQLYAELDPELDQDYHRIFNQGNEAAN
jgi:integrase